MYESYSLGETPSVKAQTGWTGLRRQPAGSGDDASSEDHLELPPGSQTQAWVSASSEIFSAIIVKWNWPRKQTRSLSISPSSPGRACLGDGFFCSLCLFVCLFGLEPSDTQHGASRTAQEWRAWRCGWGEAIGGWGGWGCVTCRPPREVTRDLPRSYQAKLLGQYTQTLGSWRQRRIAVSDPAGFYLAHMLQGCKAPFNRDPHKDTVTQSTLWRGLLIFFSLMCQTLLQLLWTFRAAWMLIWEWAF